MRPNAKAGDEMVEMLGALYDKLSLGNVVTTENRFQLVKYALAAVEDIMERQRNFPVVFSRDRWAFVSKYLEWVDRAGIKADKVELKQVDGCTGVGMFAKADIEEGEIVVTVPRNVIFTLRHLEKRGRLKNALESIDILKNMKNVSLAMGLLYEAVRGRTSFWYEYIRFLPAAYDTPLYFTEAEFAAIKHTSAFDGAFTIVRSVVRQYCIMYCAICTSGSPFQGSGFTRKTFTYENYRWAVSTVMSRLNDINYGVSDENGDCVSSQGGVNSDHSIKCPALIPHWDMVNHDDLLPLCSDYDPEQDMARLIAAKRWRKGEQVFMFYGNRTIIESLLHNGFASEKNENYCVKVKLGFNKNAQNYQSRVAAVNSRGLKPSDDYCVRRFPVVSIDDAALRFSLIFVANESQLDLVRSMDEGTVIVDKDWVENAKKYLSTRLSLIASLRKNSISSAVEDNVRPSIVKYLCLEEALLAMSSEAVKSVEWPTVL